MVEVGLAFDIAAAVSSKAGKKSRAKLVFGAPFKMPVTRVWVPLKVKVADDRKIVLSRWTEPEAEVQLLLSA